jgi:hypothetical protein
MLLAEVRAPGGDQVTGMSWEAQIEAMPGSGLDDDQLL